MRRGTAARPRVLVLGGGPAGAAAALVLADAGAEVRVCERAAAPRWKPGECLPPTVRPVLARLGLADLLDDDAVHRQHLGNRFVWGAPEPGERPTLAGVHGAGWHVDRRHFEEALASRAERAGVDWRWDAPWSADEDANSDRAPWNLVIDATGRRAVYARHRGARRVMDDRLVGTVALLRSMTPSPDRFTLVESTPRGWWYAAGLSRGRLALAFFTDGDLMTDALGDPQPGGSQLLVALATAKSRLIGPRVAEHGYVLDPEQPSHAYPAVGGRRGAIATSGAEPDPPPRGAAGGA
ncbi:MAG: tryptophan 7-halogenase, partial [Acidobacteriota bacterium]